MPSSPPLSTTARRVFVCGFCVSCGLLGGLLVQAGFEAWFSRGIELWANVSHGEMIEMVAFIVLNPVPTILCVAILWVGQGSAFVGWLALIGLVFGVAMWWRGLAGLVDRRLRAAHPRVIA